MMAAVISKGMMFGISEIKIILKEENKIAIKNVQKRID